MPDEARTLSHVVSGDVRHPVCFRGELLRNGPHGGWTNETVQLRLTRGDELVTGQLAAMGHYGDGR